jgi:type I restriction-modification system DNA methylase subunit
MASMADHHQLSNFVWQVADLLRGPYRPPQYERVMLPLTVLRRFFVRKSHEINALSAATKYAIDLLQQRRISLIFVMVTSQLRVHD